MNLQKYNRHWEKGYRYPYPKKRDLFNELLKYLEERQIVELMGLRRTGKTTLFLQMINTLLEKISPFSLWYFTFDEIKIKIDSLLKDFADQTNLDLKNEKVYVFLDEIQKVPDFQNQLKIYYDLYPNIKFFISGSTSLFIKKKTQESLAGRIVSFFLPPLHFGEYLLFRNKEEILEKPLAFSSEIEREFEIFLQCQFIDAMNIREPSKRKEYLISIIKKIIYEDIPAIFPISNCEILWRIVQIIGQNPGMFIDYYGLSRELGISNKTLSSYIFYLEEAFLIKKLFNFSRNLLTSERKLKKFYLASPSFSAAVSDFSEKGKLAENFVVSLKNHKFFWRDPYKHEVDFIITTDDSDIIPCEVKYRDNVADRELKNLLIFSKKFKVRKALLLNKSLDGSTFSLNSLEITKTPIYFI